MMSGAVFVVDSSPHEAARVGGHLQELGFEATVLGSADACLDALGRQEPLALLVSLQLADERGDVCCQRIKENYAWRHLPIIVMTETDQAHELMYCWRAAANDFVRKPVTAERLKPKLDAIRAQARGSEGDRDFRGRWVLLLESSRFYRNAIGGNLEHAGLRVLYAEEPDEAIELAEKHSLDLDACLVGLPALTQALEVGAALAAKAPRIARNLLLLATTSDVDSALDASVRKLTGSSVFPKRDQPFDLVLAKIFSHLKPAHVLELRSSERMPFFSLVEFSTDDRQWASGFSYDVSVGGIFVRTLTPAVVGEEITLRMTMAGQEAVSKGVVAWANPFQPRVTFASPVGMGVRLTKPAQRLSEQIVGLRRHRHAT